MKFRQGKAPAILYRDGQKVWEFRAGILELAEPVDASLCALLLERGAEKESGEWSVESGAKPSPKPPSPAPPEPAKPRRKTGTSPHSIAP